MEVPEQKVVISGVGQSRIGRHLAVSNLSLALESIANAVQDSGLSLSDIDGLATFPGDVKEYAPGFVGADLWDVQDALRLDLGWHATTFQGPGQAGAIIATVLAVAAGLCSHAVVYRSITESTGQAGGQRQGLLAGATAVTSPYDLMFSVGAVSAANWFAFHAQRHMYEFGTTREQLGWLAVTQRQHAARNDVAVLRDPLTLDDYLAARMISSPLCLYDCDIPVDGSTAFVLSRADAVADLRAPVHIAAAGTAMRGRTGFEQWEDLTTTAGRDVAAQVWNRTDLRPSDVDVAEFYDGFSIIALMWLEAFGFCGRGEAGPFVEGGERISLDGELPLNTYGGQLSAGRLHGFGLVAEAVRQLRHEAGPRQVEGAEVAVAGVGGGTLSGGLLLTSSRP